MPKNISKVYEAPKEGSKPSIIPIQGSFKYEQTAHKSNVATGVQVRDDIWAGDIGEVLDDPKRVEKLKAVELGAGSKSSMLGRNKSGMPWKKKSERANRLNVSLPKKSVEQRLAERKAKKALQARVAELREERIASRRRAWADAKDKEARKKVNEMRSAKYQVVNELSKTKKWKKQARKTLQKLPAEIFYQKFHNK